MLYGLADFLDSILQTASSDSADPSNDIRLVNGNSTDGTVEVRVGGQWRTVCSIFFSQSAAVVACRQLGFLGAYGYTYV